MILTHKQPDLIGVNLEIGTIEADFEEISPLELEKGDEIIIYEKNTQFDPNLENPIYEINPNTVYHGIYTGTQMLSETGLYSATGTGKNSVKTFNEPHLCFYIKPKMLKFSVGGLIDKFTLTNKTIWLNQTHVGNYRIFRRRRNLDNSQPEVTDVDEA